MTEIKQTDFKFDQEVVMPGIEPGAPYAIFEPIVEQTTEGGEIKQLNPVEVLTQMQAYAKSLAIKPGQIVGFDRYPLAQVIDNLDTVIRDEDGQVQTPPSVGGILMTAAKLAERSGFEREKATIRAQFMSESTDYTNPNLTLHDDGLSGIVEQDTKAAQTMRIVYPLGPGTLIYPDLDTSWKYGDVSYDVPGSALVKEDLSELEKINSPKFAYPTDEQLSQSNAQQVMPGKMLAFDPTRTFWHQAPESDGSRLIFVIDVQQAE